jgi:hypothetical protein
MTSIDRRWLLTSVRRVFSDRGWIDPGNATREFVEGVYRQWQADLKPPSISALTNLVPPRLSAANGLGSDVIAAGMAAAIADAPSEDILEPLIPMDEIDSFAAAKQVPPQVAAPFADPLALSERAVKVFLASIIGEAYLAKDWGGEGNDLFSARVVFGGRRVAAAFLLKGSGLRGRLTIRRLGANGDQMIRMAASPADLLIVQHVGEIDEAVRMNLVDLVRARRGDRPSLTGSVWDGIDCARLFLAHGLIDPNGTASAKGNEALTHDEARIPIR